MATVTEICNLTDALLSATPEMYRNDVINVEEEGEEHGDVAEPEASRQRYTLNIYPADTINLVTEDDKKKPTRFENHREMRKISDDKEIVCRAEYNEDAFGDSQVCSKTSINKSIVKGTSISVQCENFASMITAQYLEQLERAGIKEECGPVSVGLTMIVKFNKKPAQAITEKKRKLRQEMEERASKLKALDELSEDLMGEFACRPAKKQCTTTMGDSSPN